MKFAAVSLALLGASAVQGLATPANRGTAVQARQIDISIDGISETLDDLTDSLTAITTGAVGAVSDTLETAIDNATGLIAVINAELPDTTVDISKRQVGVPAVLARLNAILDQLQVQASILTGTALSTVNVLINQVQAIINSLAIQATTPI